MIEFLMGGNFCVDTHQLQFGLGEGEEKNGSPQWEFTQWNKAKPPTRLIPLGEPGEKRQSLPQSGFLGVLEYPSD